MDSDHSAAIFTLSEKIMTRAANKTTDWESFQIDLQNNINLNNSLRTTEQLEKEAESFTRLVQTAAYNNTKEITRISKGVNYATFQGKMKN